MIGLYLIWLSVVSGPRGMYAGGLAVPMIRQSLLEVSAQVQVSLFGGPAYGRHAEVEMKQYATTETGLYYVIATLCIV